MQIDAPPFTLSPLIQGLLVEIGAALGRVDVSGAAPLTPQLRRGNRIRSIQASLAIENNSLTLEQVTAVIEGKRVLGLPREIQEVKNAFAAYEQMEHWNFANLDDLLKAHGLLMAGLSDDAGQFRAKGVGIYQGEKLVHMAPPAKQVQRLMENLWSWVAKTDAHPLVASCVLHYELEFIHPFSDGNGRIGRLWQTLILRHWNPLFAALPVEEVIQQRQADYYQALALADHAGAATPFVEFMLTALRDCLKDAEQTDPVSAPVNDPVKRLLQALSKGPLGISLLMKALGLKHRASFRSSYLNPALQNGLIERTQPDSPHSPTQQYRLTATGKKVLQKRAR